MDVGEVIRRYLAQYANLRGAAARRVGLLWDQFGGLDQKALEQFPTQAAPVVAGAQAAAAAFVAAYFAVLLGPHNVRLPAIDRSQLTTRPTPPIEVYQRAIITARKAIADGHPFPDAMRIGRERATSTADTDVVLAQRSATLQLVRNDERIVGYRRVLTGQSCAFCATASTVRYRTDQLMPIHNRCDCGVAPILGTFDPGHTINAKLVADLKRAARTLGTRDYWKARHLVIDEDGTVHLPNVAVHEHGELGPVLTDSTDHFDGPSVAA